MLLVGFLRDEAIRVRAMLDAIGAEFVRVVLLTPPLLEGTLGEALAAPPASAAAQPATGVPRVLFVSGMSGAEAVSVMDDFAELGAFRRCADGCPACADAAARVRRSAACYLCRRSAKERREAHARRAYSALRFACTQALTQRAAAPRTAAIGGDPGRQRPADKRCQGMKTSRAMREQAPRGHSKAWWCNLYRSAAFTRVIARW